MNSSTVPATHSGALPLEFLCPMSCTPFLGGSQRLTHYYGPQGVSGSLADLGQVRCGGPWPQIRSVP